VFTRSLFREETWEASSPSSKSLFALTQSYDVLSRRTSRTEYDAYLRAQSRRAPSTPSSARQRRTSSRPARGHRRIQAEAASRPAGRAPGDRLAAGGFRQAGAPKPQPQSSARPTARTPSLRPLVVHAPERSGACAGARWRESSAGRCRARPTKTRPSTRAAAPQLAQADAQRESGRATSSSVAYKIECRPRATRQIEVYTPRRPAGARQARQCRRRQRPCASRVARPAQPRAAKQLNECPAGHARARASYIAQAEYEDGRKVACGSQSYARALVGRPRQSYDKVAIAFCRAKATCARRRDAKKPSC